MSILDRLLRKSDPRKAMAQGLADSVIFAARRPELYLAGYAEDDFDGRFLMVALHGGLVMRRLKGMGPDALAVSEKLGEVLFDRFDYAYREEGVGDASIARKVRKLGERYFGLARALDRALDGEEANLADVLMRNGLGGSDPGALAAFTETTDRHLQGLNTGDIYAAELDWPKV